MSAHCELSSFFSTCRIFIIFSLFFCVKISLRSLFPFEQPDLILFPWQSWVVQKHVLLFFNSNSKSRESKFVHMSTSSESSGELSCWGRRPKGKSSNLNKGRLEVGSLSCATPKTREWRDSYYYLTLNLRAKRVMFNQNEVEYLCQ